MKPMISEVFFLRFIACLAIVLMHSCTLALHVYNIENSMTDTILSSIQMILMFGTPMFIFISEFVISYSYPEKLPNDFFKKRLKFIFIPFIFIGIMDAAFDAVGLGFIYFIRSLILNFVGGQFHGYFILIIFQFYFLHSFFVKYVSNKYSPQKVIITSLIINFSYLAFFNFVDPVTTFPFLPNSEFIWSVLNKMPFFAWIAYFVIAYYGGKNYKEFLSFINKNSKQILGVAFLTMCTLLAIFHSGILTEVNSKRIDVIFYTLSLTFLLFILASRIKTMPNIILKISQYSFGIYLIHPFLNILIRNVTDSYIDKINVVVFVVISFLIGVVGSIVITGILNQHKAGAYLVGQVKRMGKSKRANSKRNTVAERY